MKKITEKNIVRRAFQRLVKKTFLSACCEVPLLGRSVDLVYATGDDLIAIEFKLHDWKRALRQSYDYKLGADYSYVCMPERKVSNSMRKEFHEAGIGLIFFKEHGNWPFETIIDASKSKDVWATARDNMFEYINKQLKREHFKCLTR